MNKADIEEIEYLKGESVDHIIDSLTEVISRPYIISIAKKVMEDKIPFTIMILDLDNFKQINDSFGHLSGDFILKSIGKALIDYCYKRAYIGRYGGDEFLLLIPHIVEYDDVHLFLEGLYEKGKIFRRYYNDGLRDIYVTASLGCAKFPEDSSNYEELFTKADKALYRGKIKGRNCYIIYVESKHKDIVIREKAEGSLIEHFNGVSRLFDIYKGKNQIIKYTMDFLYSELHCSGAYFLTTNRKLISNKDDEPKNTGHIFEPHLEMLLKGDKIFYETPLLKYKLDDPVLRDFVDRRSIHSVMIAKLETYGKLYGYIMICEKQITRVWQESEVALLMYVAALLEMELMNSTK